MKSDSGALGALKEFKEHFKEEYLQNFEKKALVYQTDQGLLDIGAEIDADYFKEV